MKFSKIGVGIDVSKKQLDVTFMVAIEGSMKIRGTKKFKNNLAGYEALLTWIEKYRKGSEAPLRIAMETTGVYHEGVLNHFFQAGYSMNLVPAKIIKHFAKSLGVKTKTDKVDAKVIATFAIQREYKLWVPIAANVQSMKMVVRALNSLKKSVIAANNRLHALRSSHAPYKKVVAAFEREKKFLEKEIEKLEKELLSMAQKDSSFYQKAKRIADSICGVGIQTVLKVAVETNGFADFLNHRQLVSFAGLDVVEHSSGMQIGRGKISKQGNARIRQALYMSTLSLVKHKVKPFYDLFERIVKRHGGSGNGKIALVALMRKLLVVIYALWKNDSAFDPNYETKRKENIEMKIALT